ncbi:hypothetical protein [Thermomonas flagellata]|uniref:hypothetical protein n=1 Tax=Thermomonas flagellata TaxID=2888524 RepID=UPI001F035ABB|nr:hypothetical protein [Thermomonas flagellata]
MSQAPVPLAIQANDGRALRIEPVWQCMTPALQDALVAFWQQHKAVADADRARARAAQAVCLLREEASGALLGVGTAVVRVLPRLRQPLYYYRQYFAPQVRGRGVMRRFVQACRQVLEAHNAALPQAESLGLLLELENPKIARAYRHAWEPDYQAAFIGYSPRGLPLYALYFQEAVLLPPAPLPATLVRRLRQLAASDPPPPAVAAGTP